MPEAQPDEHRQLAWEFGQSVPERQPQDRSPEIFRALGRQMTARLAASEHPVNSAGAVELALQASLDDLKSLLSPFARQRLMEYLIDQAPARSPDYRPGDPYFNATLASFGVEAVFNHIVRGLELSDPNQLVLDMGDGHGSAGSP